MMRFVFCLTCFGLLNTLALSAAGGSNEALSRGDEDTLVASFSYGQVANILNFSDQSSGNPDSWAWDFGDSGASEEPNPEHTYSAVGSYTVCLTVGRAGIGSNTYCEEVSVFSLGTGWEDAEPEFGSRAVPVISGVEWHVQHSGPAHDGSVWIVLDMQGREAARWVLEEGQETQRFNAAELPPGPYWIVDAGNRKLVARALRQH